MNFKTHTVSTAIGVAAGIMLFAGVLEYGPSIKESMAGGIVNPFTIPDVHFSYSTDECVKVINYTDEIFSCENLPTKFNHVWVQ